MSSPAEGGLGLQDELVVLCVEVSESLVEPMCSTRELQQEMVPYVLSHLLQSPAFLKLSKPERQAKVKMLTQKMLSGETGDSDGAEEADIGPHRFWSHLRSKYGTRRGHLLELLRLLAPSLQSQRVVVLRFESEVAAPTASLLVRASEPCSPAVAALHASARRDFAPGTFSVDEVGAWLQEASAAGARSPPLWSRLLSECSAARLGRPRVDEVRALVVCTEAQSTDTAPEVVALAAHALKEHAEVVPYLSSVTFGPQTSERMAALSELCAWAGGLSFNISELGTLRPTAEGLVAHLFNRRLQKGGFLERRLFYAQKQALGTCFLPLPRLVQCEQGAVPAISPASSRKATAAAAAAAPDVEGSLREGARVAFDATAPSESMLAVLSDVTLALPRRWGRSLRCWRERRELRDVVFGEPGGLGLEFDEPRPAGEAAADPRERLWRLRATHPPASALKMREQSVLLAVNHARVHEHTPRSELARRVSARPVSLTFENPPDPRKKGGGGNGVAPAHPPGGLNGGSSSSSASAPCPRPSPSAFAMSVAEVAVGELREGLPPLRKDAPPLSTALWRVGEAAAQRGARSVQQRQADKLLEAAAAWGTGRGEALPAWVRQLPDSSALGERVRAKAALDAFSAEPVLLFHVLLLCADPCALARAALACSCWRWLLLDGVDAPRPSTGSSSTKGSTLQHRLWQWVLRWGPGLAPAQRLGFWRWAFRHAIRPNGGADPGSRFVGAPAAGPGLGDAVLRAARHVDQEALVRLGCGIGGACPGLELAAAALEAVGAALRGAAAAREDELQRVPDDIIAGLLALPLQGQRLWVLSEGSLRWLVLQARCLQVALAAHQPQLFRHFMGEGVAPELFYVHWLQGLFHGCRCDADVLRLWDLFVFERSHKVFVRAAVAVFGLLESKLRGDVDQIVEVLFDPGRWGLEPGALLRRTLETKVTRSMLEEMSA